MQIGCRKGTRSATSSPTRPHEFRASISVCDKPPIQNIPDEQRFPVSALSCVTTFLYQNLPRWKVSELERFCVRTFLCYDVCVLGRLWVRTTLRQNVCVSECFLYWKLVRKFTRKSEFKEKVCGKCLLGTFCGWMCSADLFGVKDDESRLGRQYWEKS